jgi:hypothetical protein
MPTSTTPLLPVSAPAADPPLTRLQRGAIKTFSIIRFLRGVSLLVYPKLGLWALHIQTDGATYLLASLIGVRDILIAGLLFTSKSTSRSEVTRALVVNLLSDAIDAFVLIFYTAWSAHWGNPIGAIVVTAVMAIAEHFTLWGISEAERIDVNPRPTVQEAKASRMSAWLRDLRRAIPSSQPASSRNSIRRGGETS